MEEAAEHIDTGHHIMTPEKESIYDNTPRQWAAVMTSVKVAGQKISNTDYVPLTNVRLSKGTEGHKGAESCGENIYGCQRIFNKFFQQES